MNIRDILLAISLILSVFLTIEYVKRSFISDPLTPEQIKVIKSLGGNGDETVAVSTSSAKEVVKKFSEALFDKSEDPYDGKADAKHKIVIFLDPYCGACKHAVSELRALVAARSDVKVIYKLAAMVRANESEEASRELIAAHKQGKFMVFLEALNKSAAANNEERLDVAKDAGIDIKQLATDADTGEARRAIKDNMFLAEKLQIHGIPALVIGDELHMGTLLDKDTMSKLVDESGK